MNLYHAFVLFSIQLIPAFISLVANLNSGVEYLQAFFEPDYSLRDYDFIIGETFIISNARAG